MMGLYLVLTYLMSKKIKLIMPQCPIRIVRDMKKLPYATTVITVGLLCYLGLSVCMVLRQTAQ